MSNSTPSSPQSLPFENPQQTLVSKAKQGKNARIAILNSKAIMVLVVMVAQMLWMVSTLHGCDHTETLSTKQETGSIPSEPPTKSLPPVIRGYLPPDYNGPHKIFLPWNYKEHPFPCVPSEPVWDKLPAVRAPTREGLLFVRNMKTGSSTVGGITIRIARSMARNHVNHNITMCKVRFDHTPARALQYKQRNRNKSFLFSFLRNPTDRAVSEFFHFGVSRFKKEPTAKNFKEYLMTKFFLNNYFLWDMTFTNFNGMEATEDEKKEVVDQILENYDFIGVTERMNESLIVLKMLLNLQFNDILHLSAKANGGFDDGAYHSTCHYIIPSYVPPLMQDFFNGPEWATWIDGDTSLYHAAIKSLDLTIETLGKAEVNRQVLEFKRLQELAKDKCLPTTIQPCTSDGVFHRTTHNCLFWDSGCGYECLDTLREFEPEGFPNPPHVGR